MANSPKLRLKVHRFIFCPRDVIWLWSVQRTWIRNWGGHRWVHSARGKWRMGTPWTSKESRNSRACEGKQKSSSCLWRNLKCRSLSVSTIQQSPVLSQFLLGNLLELMSRTSFDWVRCIGWVAPGCHSLHLCGAGWSIWQTRRWR